MKKIIYLACCVLICCSHSWAQDQKREVLAVAQQFFDALEKGDTVKFRNLFVDDARTYFVQEKDTQVQAGGRSPKDFRFNKERIVKERFIQDGVEVIVHNRIAVVWGAYNLWINDKFSHCGVDAFTMLKTDNGWKISSLSYSMEHEGCNIK